MPSQLKSKPPLSPAKLAANRANAQKSTGPRTGEGKSASRHNALKHGLAASTLIATPLELTAGFDSLREKVHHHYQPANSQEAFHCEQIAIAQLQLQRAARYDAGLFSLAFDEGRTQLLCQGSELNLMLRDPDSASLLAQADNLSLAKGLNMLARKNGPLALLLRYREQAERHLRLQTQALLDLQTQRNLNPQPHTQDPPNDPTALTPNQPTIPDTHPDKQQLTERLAARNPSQNTLPLPVSPGCNDKFTNS